MSRDQLRPAFLIAAGLAGAIALAGPAAGQTPIVVVRGSTATDASAGASGPNIVLRGTPPPVPVARVPAADSTCPADYAPDSGLGCMPAGNAFGPNDRLYGYPIIENRQRFARRLINARGRQFRRSIGRASRFARTARFGRQ